MRVSGAGGGPRMNWTLFRRGVILWGVDRVELQKGKCRKTEEVRRGGEEKGYAG